MKQDALSSFEDFLRKHEMDYPPAVCGDCQFYELGACHALPPDCDEYGTHPVRVSWGYPACVNARIRGKKNAEEMMFLENIHRILSHGDNDETVVVNFHKGVLTIYAHTGKPIIECDPCFMDDIWESSGSNGCVNPVVGNPEFFANLISKGLAKLTDEEIANLYKQFQPSTTDKE